MKSKQGKSVGGLCPGGGGLITGCFYRCCLQVDGFITGGT